MVISIHIVSWLINNVNLHDNTFNILQDTNNLSSSPYFCGICDIRQISKPSEVWCPDCDEGLCTECLDHHILVKPSQNHTTILIAAYQNLPSYVLESKEHCSEHHEKFTLYCKQHACPCCGICMVESHRDSLDVSILQNIIKDVKTSDIFNEIEQLINEMIEIIGKIRQNRETNSCAVTEQKIVVGNEIRELRISINNHLDKLQDDLMKELTETENRITDETRDLIVSLDEKQKGLTEYQTNVVNIKEYASDLQTYLAVQQIEKEVETHDSCVQALVNSDSLNTANLSYRLDAGLKTITTSIQKFGEVIVESKPCELTFARKKDKQAQLMVADLSPPISVDNIQLNLKQKINIKGRSIRGCSFPPDSRIVLSCYSTDTISFINKEGVELFQIDRDKIGSDTYDTVYIKDSNSVVVLSGFGRNRCINIIDIVNNEILSTISMDTDIVGMAIRGGTIYYCAW